MPCGTDEALSFSTKERTHGITQPTLTLGRLGALLYIFSEMSEPKTRSNRVARSLVTVPGPQPRSRAVSQSPIVALW